jgi:dolichyl-phosphate beta-glucosyltransferase
LSSSGLTGVTVVVPCYNEANRLNFSAYRSYLASGTHARLLFVDDGSRDNTVSALEQLCSGFEAQASVLRSPANQGKAEAVRRGLLHALGEHNPRLVGYWDADLATPLDAIERFMQVLDQRQDISMVFGSRVKLLGRNVQRNPLRHYLGRIFATAASAVLELPIYDTQCGAKLFRVEPAVTRLLAEPFLSKWVFDVEIIARCRQAYGFTSADLSHVIYEYPLESWEDVAGSKVRPFDFVKALVDLIKIRVKYF